VNSSLRLNENRIEKSIRIAMSHKFACRCYHCKFWMAYDCARCKDVQPRCWCHMGNGHSRKDV